MILFTCNEQGGEKMNKIKLFRNEQNLTIRELSEKTGIATGYLSTLENDKEGKCNPTKDKMVKISTALGKTVPEVFF